MNRDRDLVESIQQDVLRSAPLAATLRKCIVLGGRVGSGALREWARRELKGYGPDDDDIPGYRTVGAIMLADAVTGGSYVKNQPIGPEYFPEEFREHAQSEVLLYQGVGELESMSESAAEGALTVTKAHAAVLAQILDQASENPYQQTVAIKWSVGHAAIEGVIDQIRTTLAELVGEILAALPDDDASPTGPLADEALKVAIHGGTVNQLVVAQGPAAAPAVSTHGPATTGALTGSSSGGPPDGNWWTIRRVVVAVALTVVAILGLVFGAEQAGVIDIFDADAQEASPPEGD